MLINNLLKKKVTETYTSCFHGNQISVIIVCYRNTGIHLTKLVQTTIRFKIFVFVKHGNIYMFSTFNKNTNRTPTSTFFKTYPRKQRFLKRDKRKRLFKDKSLFFKKD